jgi:hypothetical protein
VTKLLSVYDAQMEAVLSDLEQFNILFEQSQPALDQCKTLLTKLKIGLTKLDVPTPREIQGGTVNRPAFLARVYSGLFVSHTKRGDIRAWHPL